MQSYNLNETAPTTKTKEARKGSRLCPHTQKKKKIPIEFMAPYNEWQDSPHEQIIRLQLGHVIQIL